jgi:soluble lytic murein transglycosylase-like protein
VDRLEATQACPAPADRFRAILAGTDTRYCPNVESAAGAYAARYNRELRKLCAGSPH